MEKSVETRIDMPFMELFIGYYKIPKDTAIILDSITVAHIINHTFDVECDFEIKRNKDGEYIIIPDVSKIDLKHSMEFIIKYKKAYGNLTKYVIKSTDIPVGDATMSFQFGRKE